MYIPNKYKVENFTKAKEFMRQNSFGLLVSSGELRPIATHIPFVIHHANEQVALSSHVSRANEQIATFDKEVMVVFSGPHAYISPSLYLKKESVPTWDYVALHAYGKIKVIDGVKQTLDLMEDMIQQYDPGYMEQWNELSMDYKSAMSKGVVGFQIQVEEIHFQEKLSQNRSQEEKQQIASCLAKSENQNERELGKLIVNAFN